MSEVSKYGARIYPIDSKTILIKQTIKRPGSPRYVIDTLPDGEHREVHIEVARPDYIGAAVIAALGGALGSK